MKKTIILRTNKVDPDPRVEKEANSLLKVNDLQVFINAWDRDGKYRWRLEKLDLPDGQVDIYRIGIKGTWGKGMRSNLFPTIRYEFKLFLWLLKNGKKFDYIHACDLMTGLPALIPAKIYKKKLIYDCCDYYSDSQRGPKIVLKILKKLETMVINHSDVTLLCSEKRINQIKPAKPKEVVYIHNSPNMKQFDINNNSKRICKSSSKKLKLVYVGNFCEDRWLIPFLENSKKLNDIVEVHIGGFGGLEPDIIKIANSSDNIFFYGKLKYEDVLKLENECDCIAAFYETTIMNHIYAAPNKFYEALALGKPLIMIKNSGMSEIVEKEKIGATFETNFDSFKEAIISIENLIKKEKNLSKKEKSIFQSKYDWEIMEERLIDIYKKY